ncbi:hypothetical protein NJC40_03395 [Pseudomonas sp. 21LCFQ02]|uniref:hypothetical protein n=1 Tax=Pseudomonas sp. 21LCFQ02 TaxID=2957505 RepID=UPI00209BB6CA|nr:hypothetical protein [Pseudomonas sp. 21LCFQ02]MCO8166822.1 hypothetical protein [Pseudomonas sp. 21LCFQ02]
MFEMLFNILKSLVMIFSSLSDEQKYQICKAFVDLMDGLFRAYYRANSGAAQ